MKRFDKILLLCILSFLLAVIVTGCVDAVEINKKLIVTTIAVDKKDGEIWLYFEIANIQASEGGQSTGRSGSKYIVIKAHGKTLSEAQDNLDKELHRPVFLSGVRTLLLTENFAKEDIVEYIYRLRADENYRKKVITTTTRDDLDELFAQVHEQNESVGFMIEHTIITLDESGQSFKRSTSRLLENLSARYTGILIPCIGMKHKAVALVGYSVVNDTKVIGFIPAEDSKGLNILKTEKAKSSFVVPYKEFQFTIETILQKRRVEASYMDGNIQFKVMLAFEAKLLYGDKKTPYNLVKEDMEKMSEAVKDMIKNEVLHAVAQAQQEFQTDYLQMDDAFRIKYPVLFENLDWQTEFQKANISVDVKLNLRETYMMDYGPNNVR